MHFNRLRLHGFKSFVEPTVLEIQPGMTGIVGPNGCGKSNLVEALRWVMGENSARRMRGSEMDDVIFGGTTSRPSRNLAEVSLELDNSGRTAMAEFNNNDTIQVARQIERGSGSDYRVNGRPARQRDVQLLFADQSTGAHSTNLVGQGQIDALIRAKPQERRQILEEASGTSGLHARRHEAELKLKSAEQNLTRLDDVMNALDTQLRSLKQQVRQASRYRNLSEHIRKTEAALLQLRWAEAEQNTVNARQALLAAEMQVSEFLTVVAHSTTIRTELAAELPPLRQAEAAAAAVVQKLVLEREQIEADIRRLSDETRAAEQRLTQAETDLSKEDGRKADSVVAIEKLITEQEQLLVTCQNSQSALPQVEEDLAIISSQVTEQDADLTMLMEFVAVSEAQKQSIQKDLQGVQQRHEQLAKRHEELVTQVKALEADSNARPNLSFAKAMVDATEQEMAKRQDMAQNAEKYFGEAESLLQRAREIHQQLQGRVTRLTAEADAIRNILQQSDNTADKVIDLITVTPGLETALAVALGEALTASLSPQAAMFWRDGATISINQSLPEGVQPLGASIKAPPALTNCLSQIGLVETEDQGSTYVTQLKPGQTLVSRDGWAWRWDGLTVTPAAMTASAQRLQQRNRLAALEADIKDAESEVEKALFALNEAASFHQHHKAENNHAREAVKTAFAALQDAKNTYARQEREEASLTTKLNGLIEQRDQVASEQSQYADRLTILQQEATALPDIEEQRTEIATLRIKLAELRTVQGEKKSTADNLQREYSNAERRLASIADEVTAWQSREKSAAEQITHLQERVASLQSALAELHARPAELDERRNMMLTSLTEAEAKRREASDALQSEENRMSEIEQKLKQDEATLATSRENLVRCESTVEATETQKLGLIERMTEKLQCTPAELPEIIAANGGVEAEATIQDLDQSLQKYNREREGMGPVNLRAEVESEAVEEQIGKMLAEKNDLIEAIAKLRQGIAQLNKEARERLQGAFGQVNERFQKLFSRLFVGGKAHLELIDNEDPMQAGLEIYASPPGKKMQILSLLSGGERTLTALALLFAVFQTNPSPICVLDEAEAALDESNIGRFCSLVEDIARETGTRFLIITHQRLTMARMDRLFGVTMAEKGVSQLVSVDLAGAVAIRDGKKLDNALTETETALSEIEAA